MEKSAQPIRQLSPGHHFTFHLSALPSLDCIYFETFAIQHSGCSCNLHLSRPKSSGTWSSFFQQPNTWNGTTYYFPPPQVCVHTRLLQSCPTLCNPMDYSCQVSLSMGFSRQEHWSGLPCSPPGDPPNPGIEPTSPALQADSLPSEHQGSPMFP